MFEKGFVLVKESAAGEVQRAGDGGTAVTPIPVSGVRGLPPLCRAMPWLFSLGLPNLCGFAPLHGSNSCCAWSQQRPRFGTRAVKGHIGGASARCTNVTPRHTAPSLCWSEREQMFPHSHTAKVLSAALNGEGGLVGRAAECQDAAERQG